jgi:hypothetical protein
VPEGEWSRVARLLAFPRFLLPSRERARQRQGEFSRDFFPGILKIFFIAGRSSGAVVALRRRRDRTGPARSPIRFIRPRALEGVGPAGAREAVTWGRERGDAGCGPRASSAVRGRFVPAAAAACARCFYFFSSFERACARCWTGVLDCWYASVPWAVVPCVGRGRGAHERRFPNRNPVLRCR